MLIQSVAAHDFHGPLFCVRLCVRLFFQASHYISQLGVNHLQVPFRGGLALMPEQTADLGNRKFLFICQVTGHIVPDCMEPKSADTSPFAYGAHELWAMHVPGDGVGVQEHPFILAALLP
jgi:hypothetical protein